jgi:hypothetical protein
MCRSPPCAARTPASVQDSHFRFPCIARLTLHLVGHQRDAAHVLPLGPCIGLNEFQFTPSRMIDHVSDRVSRGSMIDGHDVGVHLGQSRAINADKEFAGHEAMLAWSKHCGSSGKRLA